MWEAAVELNEPDCVISQSQTALHELFCGNNPSSVIGHAVFVLMGNSLVWCDKRSAATPFLAFIMARSPVCMQAHGRTAVINASAIIGVPALTFARL